MDSAQEPEGMQEPPFSGEEETPPPPPDDKTAEILTAPGGEVTIDGHVRITDDSAGTAPSVSCGTLEGSDTAGFVTVDSGTGSSSCTLTFSRPFQAAPVCVVSQRFESGSALAINPQSGGDRIVLNRIESGDLTNSDSFFYICLDAR